MGNELGCAASRVQGSMEYLPGTKKFTKEQKTLLDLLFQYMSDDSPEDNMTFFPTVKEASFERHFWESKIFSSGMYKFIQIQQGSSGPISLDPFLEGCKKDSLSPILDVCSHDVPRRKFRTQKKYQV